MSENQEIGLCPQQRNPSLHRMKCLGAFLLPLMTTLTEICPLSRELSQGSCQLFDFGSDLEVGDFGQGIDRMFTKK